MRAACALKPGTPVEVVLPMLESKVLDMVLILSVEPGFGGQKFKPEVLSKVEHLSRCCSAGFCSFVICLSATEKLARRVDTHVPSMQPVTPIRFRAVVQVTNRMLTS